MTKYAGLSSTAVLENIAKGIDMVVIPEEEYRRLYDKAAWLDCLKVAGVDNWDGISYAHELKEIPCDGC